MCKNCLQNDVQEHSADGQEQKKFLEIGKSCKADFLKISFGKILLREIKCHEKDPVLRYLDTVPKQFNPNFVVFA